MIVQSGNDACVVLAEGLAGSEAAFVEQMNQKAKEIGLTNSHFANVDGLPNPDHWMTARDLATVAMRTIKDFPQFYEIYGEKEFTYQQDHAGEPQSAALQGSRRRRVEDRPYRGSRLQPGRIRQARRPPGPGRAERSAVVEGAGAGERAADRMGVPRIQYGTSCSRPAPRWTRPQVWLGEQPKVPLTVAKDLVVTVPRKSRKDMKVTVAYDQPVAAPIRKGQQFGKIVVTVPDLQPVETPLVAAADVDRMGPLGRIATVAGHMIWGSRH